MTSEEFEWAMRQASRCEIEGRWVGFFLGFGVGLVIAAVVSIWLLAALGR